MPIMVKGLLPKGFFQFSDPDKFDFFGHAIAFKIYRGINEDPFLSNINFLFFGDLV